MDGETIEVPVEPLPPIGEESVNAENAPAETVSESPVQEVQPKKKETNKPPTWFGVDGTKKYRPGKRMRIALLEVISKVNAGWKPEYELVAKKHEVKRTSLAKMMQYYRQGKIDLGDPEVEVGRKELEVRGEVERTCKSLAKYERVLNDCFEGLVKKAEQEVKDGNLLAWDQLQIPKVMSQLKDLTSLRAMKEKGALEILERLMQVRGMRNLPEDPKQVEGQVIEIPQPPKIPLNAAAMIHADRARKIQEALGQSFEAADEADAGT